MLRERRAALSINPRLYFRAPGSSLARFGAKESLPGEWLGIELWASRARLNHDLVGVTPSPVLARLERSNNGVMSLSKMLRRMLVFRVVAAADMTAGLAEAQVDPRVAHLQALLAPGGVWRHIMYLVQV